jgi:hypothetical protein
VSFNPQYPHEPASLAVNYRNEAEANSPAAPCLGSVNEPAAVKGNLCVYRGKQAGGEAAEDKNITEPGEEVTPNGAFRIPQSGFIVNKGLCNQEGNECNVAFGVVFRTAQFAHPSTTVTTASYLAAFGSWAVTAN